MSKISEAIIYLKQIPASKFCHGTLANLEGQMCPIGHLAVKEGFKVEKPHQHQQEAYDLFRATYPTIDPMDIYSRFDLGYGEREVEKSLERVISYLQTLDSNEN